MASMVQKTLEEKRLESRIEKLREKQDDLEEKARQSKKRIQALKRKKKAVLTRQVRQAPVSYTHLTLPTIYSV